MLRKKIVICLIASNVLSATIFFMIGKATPEPYTWVDVAAIKANILNEIELTDSQVKRLDMNQDGKITAQDYVILKNQMLGK